MSRPSPSAEQARIDRELDEALAETFPASDPPAPVRDADKEKAADVAEEAADRAQNAHASDVLDEALEETFPASDPPAIVQPHDADPEDPQD